MGSWTKRPGQSLRGQEDFYPGATVDDFLCADNTSMLRRCSGCHLVVYCSEDCQRKHWVIYPPQSHMHEYSCCLPRRLTWTLSLPQVLLLDLLPWPQSPFCDKSPRNFLFSLTYFRALHPQEPESFLTSTNSNIPQRKSWICNRNPRHASFVCRNYAGQWAPRSV